MRISRSRRTRTQANLPVGEYRGRAGAVLALLVSVIGGSLQLGAFGAEPWKVFTSAKYHFTAQYPASWHRLSGASDILDITNFPRSRPEDGIETVPGGAEIAVTGALPGIRTAEDWIRRDLPDIDDIAASEDTVPIPKPAPGGCIKLKQVTWQEEISEGVYFVETAYYCTTAAGFYKISLTGWQTDPNQNRLRALAIEIALSLRTQPAP